MLAPDPSGRQGVANQAGNGGTLAFGQFEPLAQTGVGHGAAGQVLQYGVLVASLDALGLGHVGELAGPAGLVPYWIDDDLELAQSIAIIEYLDETHPAPPLLPADAKGRAIAREIALVVASDIHPIGNLRVLNKLIEMGVDEATRGAWSKHWIETGFDAIEARLAHLPGPFALGEQPTLADICIVPQVFNARRFGVDLTPYKRIVGIDAAASKLDAFAAAEPGRQPDAE